MKIIKLMSVVLILCAMCLSGCVMEKATTTTTTITTTTTTTSTTTTTTTTKQKVTVPIPDKPDPVPAYTDGKYLFLGDLREKEYVTEITQYVSTMSWLYVDHNGADYQESFIQTYLEIYCSELDSENSNAFDIPNQSLSFWCKFYRFDGELSKLRYEFYALESTDTKYDKVIYVYNGEILVGEILYCISNTTQVDDVWLEKFFNDNIVVIDMSYSKNNN